MFVCDYVHVHFATPAVVAASSFESWTCCSLQTQTTMRLIASVTSSVDRGWLTGGQWRNKTCVLRLFS